MIIGTITTKHILFHPVTLISRFGLGGYVRILIDCLDSHRHCFMDYILK